MQAMVLHRAGEQLRLEVRPDPQPAPGQILIRVEACGVCRTDLHIVDGELRHPKLPLIPGHEIVGRVAQIDAGVIGLRAGMRVGIPWLGTTCGVCGYCAEGRENLCDEARFTGYDLDGGYAELCVADARFCFPLDESANAAGLAPLLCAGLIGYRSLRMAGDAGRIGIFGFGAAAHLVTQVAIFEEREVYAFTRPGDLAAQTMARDLGCVWAGGSDEPPPEPLDAAIIFAPVGALVPLALKAARKGGTVVCGGIYMSRIPAFDYDLLWGERSICSVANLVRQDAIEFLELARRVPVVARTTVFPLRHANEALDRLRAGSISGAAVLVP
ncbi:MAG: zinc-dependent alcohol dehydrogenase family protein [Rhizobiales bacterium]|nr:zinc-dependent alcohol dehydrogenase family protein [Hyphomicrobiales bacterium]